MSFVLRWRRASAELRLRSAVRALLGLGYNVGEISHLSLDAMGVMELLGNGVGNFAINIEQLRLDVAAGAGHECGEWPTARGTCALCYRAIAP